MIRGNVTGLQLDGNRITAAQTKDKSHRADTFVLATGHHIGGGLRKEHPTREPLLNLGVFHDGKPLAAVAPRLQRVEYIDSADQFESGLATDERLHPLDAAGRVQYENLFAAGAVLGGYEYAGPCGFGVPILTGWLAGRWAARGAR
jgi:glycerol-3-phosphate dehydrogenase subunit B